MLSGWHSAARLRRSPTMVARSVIFLEPTLASGRALVRRGIAGKPLRRVVVVPDKVVNVVV